MNIDHEDPRTPDAREAAIDALLDAMEPPHDCGSCEWCVAIATRTASMIPALPLNPPF